MFNPSCLVCNSSLLGFSHQSSISEVSADGLRYLEPYVGHWRGCKNKTPISEEFMLGMKSGGKCRERDLKETWEASEGSWSLLDVRCAAQALKRMQKGTRLRLMGNRRLWCLWRGRLKGPGTAMGERHAFHCSLFVQSDFVLCKYCLVKWVLISMNQTHKHLPPNLKEITLR